MTLIFSRERISDNYDEMYPLIEEHYKEVAWNPERVPLDVDRERYIAMNEEGTAICFTGRDERRKLLAYCIFFLAKHPHYKSTTYAVNDAVFVHPSARGASNGRIMVEYCEAELKALGAQVITWHIKSYLDWSPLVRKLGYDPTDCIWQKWIGSSEEEPPVWP